MKRTMKLTAKAVTAGAAAVGMMVGFSGQAAASTSVEMSAYYGGKLAGSGYFNADPSGSVPGDAIRACDLSADGVGIEVRMDINPSGAWRTDRVASTRGHNSPYCSPWMSGNIAEETTVALKICAVKGTWEDCSPVRYTKA
ncbi:hypothetical protein QCN29_09565 [Streptomyces sp. HNM0663]|uniref:Secreted protein n=1 Tax=Streptomyces chengmaiensis TaxID=3040919 RepID=A0ABT6HLV0_9ACTN|nr:hypothetical protein [Streptomyces chengmaiensis]MDH2389034.1 hypothetical protein [Streptomyces chengmaiensis]